VHKILIIKLRAIGDVVLSTIVIDNLRRSFPAATIDFLTEAACQEVVLGHPQLDDVIVLDRKSIARLSPWGQLRANCDFLRRIRAARYDLVFDFFGNPRSALLTWYSGAAWRVGYNYRMRQKAYNVVVPSRASEVHEAEWHLDALDRLGIPTPSRHLAFSVSAAAEGTADSFWREAGLHDQLVMALNFSGGWAAKRWPIERFASLAGKLVERYGARIIAIWGPGEETEAHRLAESATVPVTLIPKTGLKELAAILARVDLMITTDSGPMHIAAAMATPCVALFGPTDYRLQGPYGRNHQIVVKQGLACLGCNRIACDHISCMNGLMVEDVLAAVERAMAPPQPPE
jgi:lipopolysaccharide heptosyltransferase I